MTQNVPTSYTAPPGLLRDRVILVTGAGSGLGRATALACAAVGATVVLAGRTAAKLEAVDDAIRAAGGPAAALYPINLAGASWADYAQLAETLEREFGRLDGIAHCAAHFKGFGPLVDVAPKDWLETLQVNLTAPFALTRHCLPLLAAGTAGSVVFVSDESGRRGKAYSGAYGVAKFALEGLMQVWAEELEAAGRVRVNTLDPGPMDTPLRRRGFAQAAGAPAPDASAPWVVWLLGPDSAPASGRAFSARR